MTYDKIVSDSEITEDLILKWYSQEEVIQHFCDIEAIGERITSPLREDSNDNLSCEFIYAHNGNLLFIDLSANTPFVGDWISIAGYFYGINPDGKAKWYTRNETIKRVYRELILGKEVPRDKVPIKPKDIKIVKRSRKRADIVCTKRQWTYQDYYFWHPIPFEVLEYYDVFPVDSVFYNGVENMYLRNKYGDPTYGYMLTIERKQYWKIYKPYSKQYKWRNNYPYGAINGKDLEGDKILCTSLKDAMLTRMVTGIPTYCYQSESHIPETLIPGTRLLIRDNDEAGLKYAETMKERHKLEYLTFTGGKDVFDINCIKALRDQWLNYLNI